MSKHKVVLVGSQARDKVIKGANFLADAVKLTLGPYGLNSISGIRGGVPHITNDGVSIAKEISLKDEAEDLGVRILREASMKAGEEAGDGTTTATVLAQAITNEAIRILGKGEVLLAGKQSVVQVKNKIKEETRQVVEKLKSIAQPVTSREQLIEVTKVSVEDDHLAELIGGLQWDLGKDGVILAEETAEITDSIERINGIRIDNGLGTATIINNFEKQSLEVNNVKVLLTNFTFQSIAPLKKILSQLIESGHKSVVIVGRAFSEVAIRECLKNHEMGVMLYPINAPYVNQHEIMKDLTSVLGGKYICSDQMELSDIELSDVAFATKVVAERYNAVFVGESTNEAKERIQVRINKLDDERKGSVSSFEKNSLTARISQLRSGFALMKVGALSDAERKYKKDKVDDAVNAARAALQEGVVPGAGLALKVIAEEMPSDSILKKALVAPYNQIITNAGETFDIPEWVKDPVKVVRIALEKASSVASILATTGIAINHETERPRYVQESMQTSEEEVE